MSSDQRSSDPQSLEAERSKARDAEQHQRRTELEDLRWLMSDKRGRRVMWRLLATAKLYSVVLTGDNRAHVNEGRREVGLRFLDDIQGHMPGRFVEMLKEHAPHDDPR